MNKKLILLMLACCAGSVLTVLVLFAMSGAMKDHHSSFLREFPPHPAREGDSLNLKHDSYYIAGGTPTTVYLGNALAPLYMIEVNLSRLDTQHIHLDLEGIHGLKFYSPRVHVDSPYFYLADGAIPILYKGKVHDWKGEKYLSDSIYFREFVPIANGSFAIKSLSGSTGENILGKLTEWAPYRAFTDHILEKQQDGVFCTDGILRYDKESSQLVYLYFYRNQFMVMDTSLNLQYRGNTIDTTSRARIETATIESERTKTLSSPPFFVNKGFDVSGEWLFVNSNLLAKNEHQKAFDQGSVIDLYNLKNGKYIYSFYIYHFNNVRRMTEFRVFGNKMVVRYDHMLQVFDLKPEYFIDYSLTRNK